MSERLNILWFVTDHQVFGNWSIAPDLQPLQARLAARGVRFTRAYTVLPVCSPARASMLTGLYPHAHGLTENDGRFGGRPGLSPDDWLLHQPLLQAGYRCAWFGKWHLDNRRSARDYGFEGFSLPGYGYPYASAAYLEDLAANSLETPKVSVELPGETGEPDEQSFDLTRQDNWFAYEAGCARLHGSVETHEAYFLARLAGNWLSQIGNDPFFVRIDPWGPHPPYIVGSPYYGRVQIAANDLPQNFHSRLAQRPAHHADYAAFWETTLGLTPDQWLLMAARAQEHAFLVETALVNVLDSLERLGLSDRTLVIFCADHGDAVASNGRVSNKGGLMVEETMRIPMLVSGPGITGGRQINELVANIDLAPTVLEACGINPGHPMHGDSLWPLLSGGSAPWRQGLMAEHYGLHERLVQRAYYRDEWKYVIQQDGFEELYDLKADPFELHNLAGAHSAADTRMSMKRGLVQRLLETGDFERAIAPHLTI